ncbi:MAG: calcium-binding protein [Actinomycetota bacterium]
MRRSPALPVAAALLAVALLAPPAASDPTPVPGPTSSPDVPGRVAAPPCTIEGTDDDDVLTGTAAPDVICGHGGDDVLQGLDGDDVLDGGDGIDTASFEAAPCCIRADLATGWATGAGNDQLVSIENLTGSQGDDVLRGDGGPNVLSGLGGTDLLYGGDGDDALLGGDGDDYLAGEGGTNTIDGGEGADICPEGTGVSCYVLPATDPDDTEGILDVRLVTPTLGASPSAWRISTFGRASKPRLWDEGYFVVSFDSKGDAGFDFHVVIKSSGRRMRALVLREGVRRAVGRVRASRPGGRGVRVRVPLERLEIPPERAYYRWSVRTILTARRCRPCLDVVPAEIEGAFPQPVI